MSGKEILTIILQAVSVLIVVMTFVIAQAQAAKRRQTEALGAIQKKLAEDLQSSETRLNDDLDRLTKALTAEQDNRVTNINRCHERIDDMQKNLISDLMNRMGSMEGEMKGMRVTLETIQRWFISQAKGC